MSGQESLLLAQAATGSGPQSLSGGIQKITDALTGSGVPGQVDAADVIVNAVQFLLGLVAVLALLAIVWGGVMYITSLGDEKKMESAKKIVLAAVIGVLIAGFSLTILTTVKKFISG